MRGICPFKSGHSFYLPLLSTAKLILHKVTKHNKTNTYSPTSLMSPISTLFKLNLRYEIFKFDSIRIQNLKKNKRDVKIKGVTLQFPMEILKDQHTCVLQKSTNSLLLLKIFISPNKQDFMVPHPHPYLHPPEEINTNLIIV